MEKTLAGYAARDLDMERQSDIDSARGFSHIMWRLSGARALMMGACVSSSVQMKTPVMGDCDCEAL